MGYEKINFYDYGKHFKANVPYLTKKWVQNCKLLLKTVYRK